MLLLDEPTNHLDAESVAWLERFLHDFEGTVVAITHDRYFLDNVAGWILELDRGEGIPWEGNYSSWLEQKDQRLAQEASQEAARRKSIEKELEWVRQGAKGRQSKGKARLARFEELNNVEYQKRNETNELFIPPGPRLGDKVLEVSHLRKSYGDRVLIDDLSFSVPKGAIVGIIGPNGAGKSTLFRMMSGQEQPDSGTITLGETVKLASVDQFRDAMDNSKTVWEEVSGGLDIMKIGNTEMPSRAYVGRFNFKGVDQGKRVGELSGGERGRLHLAKLLQVGGNVLLLDEPTNDLDIETLRALENALLEFPGCAMVISHDRWFLDRIATHILDYQDEGKVEFFEGNFTEYEEYKKRTRRRRAGAEANQVQTYREIKRKKATQVAFFNVCSLSHWERVGVRATARRAPTPARPSAVSPARRSAGTGHRSPTPSHGRIRSRSLSTAIPATTETLYDPPSSQDCAVHRPPTGYCSPAGSPGRSGIHQSAPAQTGAHVPRTSDRRPEC